MDESSRYAVVASLANLAKSPDYRDRADAGRALASFAEVPAARDLLLTLLLDADDTFVTRVTAEALFRRQDAAALAVAAAALAGGGLDHLEWIHAALLEVFGVYADERDAAVRRCEILRQDPAPDVRRGAAQLIAALEPITPILVPEASDLDD